MVDGERIAQKTPAKGDSKIRQERIAVTAGFPLQKGMLI